MRCALLVVVSCCVGCSDGRFDDTLEALLAPLEASPDDFVDTVLHLEAAECSEDAAVLTDTRDGTMWIIRTLPNC